MEEIKEFEDNEDIYADENGYDDIQANVKKVFKRCLEKKPVTLYEAHQAIRLCIEIYCRYEKAFNLTQLLFLEEKESPLSKMTRAGVDSDKREKLAEIYKKTHRFMHPSHSLVGMTQDKMREEMEIVRTNINQLLEWHIDDVDIKAGMPVLYVAQDRRLKDLLDNKLSPDEYKTFLEEKSLQFYFNDVFELKKSMEANNVEVPYIQFKNKKDVEKYLALKKEGAVAQAKQEYSLDAYKESAKNGNPKAYLRLIDHYYEEKDFAQLLMYYKDLMMLKDFDDGKFNADEKIMLGVILRDCREYDEALKWVDKITSEPNAMMIAGDCYCFKDDYITAAERYRCVGIDKLRGSERQFTVAEQLRETDPGEALKYYNLCSSYIDSDPQILKDVGDCYLKIGEIRSALSQYEKAISINNSKSLGFMIADMLSENLSYEKAKDYAKQREKNNDILKQITGLLFEYGDLFKAIKWLEKYALDANDQTLFEEVGYYYFSQGTQNNTDDDIARAAEWFERCVDRVRDDARIATVIIDCFYRCRRSSKEHAFWSRTFEKTVLDNVSSIDEAVEIYKKCDINSMSGVIQKLVGDYCLKNGETAEAVNWYAAYAPQDYTFIKDTADKLWEDKEHAYAVQLYEVYAKNNVNITIYKLLGDYYINRYPEKAVVWYEEYCRQSKKDNEDIIRIILKHYNKHKAYRSALEWYKKLGNILFSRGEAEAAIEQYDRYSRHSREYSNVTVDVAIDYKIGDYYSEKQQWDLAFMYYKKACDYIWNKYRSRWQYEEKNVRRAIAAGEKALEICKDASIVNNFKHLTQMLGDLLYDKGDKAGAFAEYIKCVDKKSVPNPKQVVFRDTYIRIVEYYLTQGNVDEASDWYWSRCRGYKCSDFAKSIGDIYWGKSNTKEAIKYYEEYCGIEEENANGYFHGSPVEEYQKYVNELRTRGIPESDIESREDYIRLQSFNIYFGSKKESDYPSVLKRLIALYGEEGNDGQKLKTLRKLADVLRRFGNHLEALDAYMQAGVQIVDPEYQRTLGECFFKTGKTDEALAWFEKSRRDGDADFDRYVGDLYFEKRKKAIAVVWYERSLSFKADADVAKRVAKYYESKKQIDKVVDLQEMCFEKHGESLLDRYYIEEHGDNFYKNGSIDEAVRCYKTIKKASSVINLKLAECYYYSGKYDKAEEELAAYTKHKVSVHNGFAITSSGAIYLARNNRLAVVERNLIKSVNIKKSSSSNKRSATIYFHKAASGKYPQKIVLFKDLDSDSLTVKTLEKQYVTNKEKNNKVIQKIKQGKAERSLGSFKTNAFNASNQGYSKLNIFGLALITVVGLIGLYIALAYSFADSDGFTHWFWIVGIPFVINTFITKFVCKERRGIAGLMTWGTLILQYIINVGLQWWLWLDPNDGEPAVGEFIWYGIAGPILSTCLFALIYFLMIKVFTNDD